MHLHDKQTTESGDKLVLSATESLTLSQTSNLDSPKLEMFADDNFKFDENGRKFSEWVENTERKGEIARYEQFVLVPQCFQKTCSADTENPVPVLGKINISKKF